MSEKVYYVVWAGLAPGIYSNYEDAIIQVRGIKGRDWRKVKGLDLAKKELGRKELVRLTGLTKPLSKSGGAVHYVVLSGINPGVYSCPKKAELQVRGVKGSKWYSTHPDKSSARKFFKSGEVVRLKKTDSLPLTPTELKAKRREKHLLNEKRAIKERKSRVSKRPKGTYLTVDASYSSKSLVLEWRGVMVQKGIVAEEVFRGRVDCGSSADIGEFLAIVDGIKYLRNNQLDIPIYSDSLSAQSWIEKRTYETKLELTNSLNNLLAHARHYLFLSGMMGESEVKIIDWQTSNWDEIPADFGRK